MTNRQRILATSEYDILCRIQQYMDKGCVCEAITQRPRECLKSKPDEEHIAVCEECIQKFLNEEAK